MQCLINFSSKATNQYHANDKINRNVVKLNEWSEFELRSSRNKIELIINGNVLLTIPRDESEAIPYDNIELLAGHPHARTPGLIKDVKLCPIDG